MRDETTVRRDAKLWALIAELEALKTEREGMIGHGYSEGSFMQLAKKMREVKEKMEEV